MEKEDQRNFLIAMVLMIGFVWAYQTFIMKPAQEKYEAQQAVIAAETANDAAGENGNIDISKVPAVAEIKDVKEALTLSPRVKFDAESVDGSIRLKGARIDDLSLKRHFLTVEREKEVRVFRPEETEYGYYASYYWFDADNKPIVGPNTEWTQVGSGTLTETSPIILRAVSGGVTIDRQVSVDSNYMFAFTDTVANTSGVPISVRPYGTIVRKGPYEEFLEATDPGSAKASAMVFMGVIGAAGNELRLRKYKPLFNGKKIKGENDKGEFLSAKGGWWGMTDKYWMGALVPQQDTPFISSVNKAALARESGLEIRTISDDATVIAPGANITVRNHIFAGAKRLNVLRDYEKDLGVPQFVDAIDWGWAFFLTKPFFYALLWLKNIVGGFGLAILAFTVLIKIPLLPLYNASYKSMAKMKKLQEPMKEINERFKGDPQRKQQEIMKLYKQEGANPVGGCLPILLTIPIFYALYKTLFVTLEMRHESFLYLTDLSAPDPSAIGNLFGLIPWMSGMDIKAIPIIGIIIGIGILPILYGVTMAAMQSLNPPPADPTQAKVIKFLPLIFMFVFGGFASGLVLYWVWNNILSFVQQYIIMRRNGVDTEIGKTISKLLGRPVKDEA
jgi:YidC/Oxa1 family membrane protein insertase